MRLLPLPQKEEKAHTSAYGSIRQHTSAYVSIRRRRKAPPAPPAEGGGEGMEEAHTSAYGAYVTNICRRIRQTFAPPAPPAGGGGGAYVRIRQHTAAYVSIRQHTSAYLLPLPQKEEARVC